MFIYVIHLDAPVHSGIAAYISKPQMIEDLREVPKSMWRNTTVLKLKDGDADFPVETLDIATLLQED